MAWGCALVNPVRRSEVAGLVTKIGYASVRSFDLACRKITSQYRRGDLPMGPHFRSKGLTITHVNRATGSSLVYFGSRGPTIIRTKTYAKTRLPKRVLLGFGIAKELTKRLMSSTDCFITGAASSLTSTTPTPGAS